MSWEQMNNHELQAMRKMLMLDVSEAAEFVGKVSARTWQHWEAGKYNVPDDVQREIYGMCEQVTECVDSVWGAKEHKGAIRWYHTYDDFLSDYPNGNKAWWKLHQAVCAEIFASSESTTDCELRSDTDVDKTSAIYKFFSRTRDCDKEFSGDL